MPPDECSLLADRLDVTVGEEETIGQFAPRTAGECEHCADATVDVAAPIAPRGAGGEGQLVVGGLVGVEVRRQLLQRRGALLEGQAAERGPADATRVVDHRSSVEARGRDTCDRVACGRIDHQRALIGRGIPPAAGIAGEHLRQARHRP